MRGGAKRKEEMEEEEEEIEYECVRMWCVYTSLNTGGKRTIWWRNRNLFHPSGLSISGFFSFLFFLFCRQNILLTRSSSFFPLFSLSRVSVLSIIHGSIRRGSLYPPIIRTGSRAVSRFRNSSSTSA